MSIMFHLLVTVSLLLSFLTVSACDQQQLKGGQLVSAKHVGAIAMNPESATSIFRTSVGGSESVSSIALQEGVNGYLLEAYYADNTCTSFVSAIIYPLNVCFSRYDLYTGYWYNVKIVATSSTWRVQSFTDNECAVAASSTGNGQFNPYQTECKEFLTRTGEAYKMFVQPTKEAPTAKSVLYSR
jgi:hypothetical protein